MKPMRYKGYSARIEYSDEDGCFVGRVAGVRDLLTFHGRSDALDFLGEWNGARCRTSPTCPRYTAVATAAEVSGASISAERLSEAANNNRYYGAIEKSRFDSGEIIEVILGYDDFKTLLQKSLGKPIGRRSLCICRMRLMPC